MVSFTILTVFNKTLRFSGQGFKSVNKCIALRRLGEVMICLGMMNMLCNPNVYPDFAANEVRFYLVYIVAGLSRRLRTLFLM